MRIRRQMLRARRFHALMPHRVREVLLVSSPFDAFILEEDGLLSEQLYLEYMEVSLTAPPRFTHVTSGQGALDLLEERRFDLILAIPSISDMPVEELAARVEAIRPGRPVVLLALDRKDLQDIWNPVDQRSFDGAFLWSGDANILLAIIEFVEDRANVDHDVENGNVRVIIMLEDSPRYYSSFLGLLYKELFAQARSLYTEGIDELHRQMYLKSRPKILHATTYEQGTALFQRYKRNVMAVICDLRLPRAGQLDDFAGVDFALEARRYDSEIPVLLQSAEGVGARRAQEMNARFVDKNSPSLLAETSAFLRENLGFGDFVFRRPDGEELARASDLHELERKLATVPAECIVFHATHNHFSIWLQARSEFELAEKLRPRRVSDFDTAEDAREFLISLLRETHRSTYAGVVSDFSRSRLLDMPFSRLGVGPLGGKARGLAFFNRLLTENRSTDFAGLSVRLPRTVVVTAEYFDRFLEENDLASFVASEEDEELIEGRFLEATLPEDLLGELEFLAIHLDRPLAVRSSSLLEDSLHQILAGIYSTVMLPNDEQDPKVRLRRLGDAIKLVYASTFHRSARAYLENTGHLVEEEKMAVIVQPVVGWRWGTRYYPVFSGVAHSTNFYPLGQQRPEDGVVHVALGLGRQIVDGGRALRFSPRHPGVLPQFTDAQALLDATQRGFFGLDMRRLEEDPGISLHRTVRYYGLEAAEEDGSLGLVGSVYDAQDDRITDDLSRPGPRVVTFNNVLRHRALPLAEALDRLLEVAKEGLGGNVELEFAWDGRALTRATSAGGGGPALHILQVRPMVADFAGEVAMGEIDRDRILCASEHALGHGMHEDVHDLVYVRLDRWDASKNRRLAEEIGRMNARLKREDRPYVLIGPGRWGTADEWLGIPVDWAQISNVRVLVEASPSGYRVEPSQGTHFFQNMTSLRLGYLTVPPRTEAKRTDFVDWAWLAAREAETETEHLRLLRFERPLVVMLDGRRRRGLVAKPDETQAASTSGS